MITSKEIMTSVAEVLNKGEITVSGLAKAAGVREQTLEGYLSKWNLSGKVSDGEVMERIRIYLHRQQAMTELACSVRDARATLLIKVAQSICGYVDRKVPWSSTPLVNDDFNHLTFELQKEFLKKNPKRNWDFSIFEDAYADLLAFDEPMISYGRATEIIKDLNTPVYLKGLYDPSQKHGWRPPLAAAYVKLTSGDQPYEITINLPIHMDYCVDNRIYSDTNPNFDLQFRISREALKALKRNSIPSYGIQSLLIPKGDMHYQSIEKEIRLTDINLYDLFFVQVLDRGTVTVHDCNNTVLYQNIMRYYPGGPYPLNFFELLVTSVRDISVDADVCSAEQTRGPISKGGDYLQQALASFDSEQQTPLETDNGSSEQSDPQPPKSKMVEVMRRITGEPVMGGVESSPPYSNSEEENGDVGCDRNKEALSNRTHGLTFRDPITEGVPPWSLQPQSTPLKVGISAKEFQKDLRLFDLNQYHYREHLLSQLIDAMDLEGSSEELLLGLDSSNQLLVSMHGQYYKLPLPYGLQDQNVDGLLLTWLSLRYKEKERISRQKLGGLSEQSVPWNRDFYPMAVGDETTPEGFQSDNQTRLLGCVVYDSRPTAKTVSLYGKTYKKPYVVTAFTDNGCLLEDIGGHCQPINLNEITHYSDRHIDISDIGSWVLCFGFEGVVHDYYKLIDVGDDYLFICQYNLGEPTNHKVSRLSVTLLDEV